MTSNKWQESTVSITGQLIGFILKDGYKLKYLRMNISEREYWFKVPKELRQSFDPAIQSGCFLEIQGMARTHRKNGKLELTADSVAIISQAQAENPSTLPSAKKGKKGKNKGKILICQKSDCWKRGGKKICAKLQQELSDRGLGETVTVQKTGCLKKCKKGPNIVVLPEKAHYPLFKTQEVGSVVEKHFGT
ncbi:MAG: (2Fe-2S) ferredoxin domain-containing protein [Microcystaceae cyanobacterium]